MDREVIDYHLVRYVPSGITLNFVTATRLGVGAYALHMYLQGYVWVTFVIFIVAALTDYLDGAIARQRGLATA